MENKLFLRCLCMALTFLIMTGCATKIDLQAQRTPTLDTTGMQRIAVMPFEYTNSSYANLAQHATTAATDRIRATNHFTLVSPSAVLYAKNKGESIESYVDAMFTGQITRVDYNTTSEQGSYKDKDGNTITYVTYKRTVEVDFTYYFERARDGTLIGPIIKKGKAGASSDDSAKLASVDSLLRNAIDDQFKNLYRDVAPYTISVRRSLIKEPNKYLKSQMDAAHAHVKGGNYVAARNAYLAIWESNQSVAAAVNASVLYEALGETQNAANFMQQVFAATGSPLASQTLAQLNNELAEQIGVKEYASAGQSSTEKAAKYAVSEIHKILPKEPKLWIHNNVTTNQNLVNDVIDNMTSAFVSSGVAVIERQSIDLILKEQNFQLSGNVSDDDFVSIGHLSGANTVIIVGVTGTGTGRRLQVRVLDINSGTVVLQSSTSSEWNL